MSRPQKLLLKVLQKMNAKRRANEKKCALSLPRPDYPREVGEPRG